MPTELSGEMKIRNATMRWHVLCCKIERLIETHLCSESNKILVIDGARQTVKTLLFVMQITDNPFRRVCAK